MDTTSPEALAELIQKRLAECGQGGIATLFARYVELTTAPVTPVVTL